MDTIDFTTLRYLQSRVKDLENEIKRLHKTIAVIVYCAPNHKIDVTSQALGLELELEEDYFFRRLGCI